MFLLSLIKLEQVKKYKLSDFEKLHIFIKINLKLNIYFDDVKFSPSP